MSKRFIDTGLFDDDWFMDLSKDAKLLWVYYITKCDHAGIIKLNEKLCKVQTDIKDLEGVIKQLGNRLVTVSEHLYFIPKFIEFQYPGFPNSKVRQQQSAVDILIKYGLFDKESLTLTKQLNNSYEHEHDNDTVNEPENVEAEFSLFWDSYHTISGMIKTDKDSAEKHWKKLKKEEQQKAIDNIKPYYDSLNDKKFCKKARTYLSDKNFNDEFTHPDPIIKPTSTSGIGALIPVEDFEEPPRYSNANR